MITRNIQYRYSVDTKYGVFSDALYFPEDKPWTQEQIDAEIKARVERYEYAAANPPEPRQETLEEVQAAIDGYAVVQSELLDRRTRLIAEMEPDMCVAAADLSVSDIDRQIALLTSQRSALIAARTDARTRLDRETRIR